MRFLDDLMLVLTAACQAGSSAFISAAAKTTRKTCLMVGLFVVALALLLGGLGLMIAALFIALTPHLGLHWVAMIAAAAAFAGCGIFVAVAMKASNGR